MDIYKLATKNQLRFKTTQGVLSVEQLWDLSLTKLSNSIKNLKKELKSQNDDELSFLDDNFVVDKEKELQFEILKDVYLTKKKELEDERTKAQNKETNQHILNLIKLKKDQELASKSVEELEAMLK